MQYMYIIYIWILKLEVILDLRLIPSTMIGIGLDNTSSMIGTENGAAAILKKEYAPYLQVNGCFGHLINYLKIWDIYITYLEMTRKKTCKEIFLLER